MDFHKHIFLTNRLFLCLTGIVLLFTLGFSWTWVFYLAVILLAGLFLISIGDAIFLFKKVHTIRVRRKTANILSLGSINVVHFYIENANDFDLFIDIYEELPYQLQMRKMVLPVHLKASEKKNIDYSIRPLVRGEYNFGDSVLFVKSRLGLIERRIIKPLELNVPVYPSLIQMKQFELMAVANVSLMLGVKKMRRLGQSYEFDQIKTYVRGDDYRNINWKATGRKQELMVNQFEEEKSQQVLCVIDSSRNMLMPFDGLSLLDHAINTSLVISNTALLKQDKVGLLTFSDKIDRIISPDKSRTHLKKILEGLYKQEEKGLESNYELLYYCVKNVIKSRSLLFLFTNFESYHSLERVLPVLRKLNIFHLLVVIFFENNEVIDFGKQPSKNLEEVYYRTIAQKYSNDKKQIITELRKYGIQVIYTRPENLTINTLNKYLELKARGLI